MKSTLKLNVDLSRVDQPTNLHPESNLPTENDEIEPSDSLQGSPLRSASQQSQSELGMSIEDESHARISPQNNEKFNQTDHVRHIVVKSFAQGRQTANKSIVRSKQYNRSMHFKNLGPYFTKGPPNEATLRSNGPVLLNDLMAATLEESPIRTPHKLG